MVVWKGFGILNFIIGALLVSLAATLNKSVYGNAADAHDWMQGLAIVIAGVAVWFLGKALNKKSDAKMLIDAETGEQYRLGTQHSLFFIRMEYWGPIFVIIGLIIMIL